MCVRSRNQHRGPIVPALSGIARWIGSTALIFLGALAFSAAGARATTIVFPAMPATPGTSVDNCASGKCLFSYAAVPAGAAGETLRSWSFYALTNTPVAPVIFNSMGRVIGLGAPVTPSTQGINSAIFALQSGTNVLAAGDTVGFYYANGGGTIAFDNTGPGVTYKPLGAAENLVVGSPGSPGTQVTTFVANRTYDVSYAASSDQVSLALPPAGPSQAAINNGSVINDGAVATYFEYAPVTSQYNGQLLTSWSFYALTSNQVIPVIYSAGPFSHVIGYGQAETPVAGEPGVLQTFAYVPVAGSNVLQTGEMLGWYDPVSGSIAFSLTGGTGVSYNPNFPGAPQTGIFPFEVTPNRNYYVGFTTASGTAAPEPQYTVVLRIALGCLRYFRRNA
jgi:hypothetical protein